MCGLYCYIHTVIYIYIYIYNVLCLCKKETHKIFIRMHFMRLSIKRKKGHPLLVYINTHTQQYTYMPTYICM